MAILVVSFLLLVGAVVAVAKRRIVLPAVPGRSTGHSVALWPAAVGLGVLAIVLLAVSSVKTVGARDVGIPITFGTIGTDLQSGVHVVAPWTTVTSCPLAEQQSIQSDRADEGDKTGNDSIPVNGKDLGQANLNVAVSYHFDRFKATQIYREYGCSPALVKENLIRQATRKSVSVAASEFNSVDLQAHKNDIDQAAFADLSPILSPHGVVIDTVIISDVKLSEAAQQGANQKLAAQQAAQQAQFALQKAQTDKQTQEVQAEAAAAANQTQAASLSAAVLCKDWIDAIAQGHVQVVTTAGPCGGASTSSPSLQIQVPAPAGK